MVGNAGEGYPSLSGIRHGGIVYPFGVSEPEPSRIPLSDSSRSVMGTSVLLTDKAVLGDYPSSPQTNLRAFLDYGVSDDSLASLNQPGPVANYDPGGEDTGVLER